MKKSDFVAKIAEKNGISQSKAKEVVDSVFAELSSVLESGDSYSQLGFGTFSVAERPARTGRNPRTGEAVEYPAAKVVKFKAGSALKEAVNK